MEIAKILEGLNSKTVEPIDKKLAWVITSVGDDSPHAKIQNNRPLGAWRRMREISPSRGF